MERRVSGNNKICMLVEKVIGIKIHAVTDCHQGKCNKAIINNAYVTIYIAMAGSAV